jgi:AcrR family transcriptional regulator
MLTSAVGSAILKLTRVVGGGGLMKDVLLEIESSKKEKIINAAIVEFSQNGYEKASTNAIVKRAGVSKGLIYHYFKNKQTLYDYLIYYVFDLIMGEIDRNLNFEEPDIFKRLKEVAIIKMGISMKHPYIYDIVPKFYENKTYEEIKELAESFSPDLFQRVLQDNVDYSLFKDDIDVENALKILTWTIEKMGEEEMQKMILLKADWDIDGYAQKFDSYMDILKNTFYK